MTRNIRKCASCWDSLLAKFVNYGRKPQATAREGAAALARFCMKSMQSERRRSLFTIERVHRSTAQAKDIREQKRL
jgi:hypothetical protein